MKHTLIYLPKRKTLTVTAELLLKIFEKTDDFFFCLNYPSLTKHMSARAARQYLEYKWHGVPHPINLLNKKGYIEIKKLNDQILVKITSNGKIIAQQLRISLIRKPLPEGQILIVAFDIPERAKGARTVFRRSLKRMGFKQIQKSIWATSFCVIKEMNDLIESLCIKKWVKLFKSIAI